MELLEPLGPLPWQPIVVCPTGDIQAGSSGTDWNHLDRHIAKALSRNAYFVGTGDYGDFLSPSNRRALVMAGLYDTAMEIIEERCGEESRLLESLAPTKGRWLGLTQGHHHYDFSRNDTTDTRLAGLLDCKFLGDAAVLTFNFRSDQMGVCAQGRMFVTHGTGKGWRHLDTIAPGFPNVDVFVMGHNCQIEHKIEAAIEIIDGNHMRNRDQHYVLAGSFFRGYAEGSTVGKGGRPQGSYVERAGMRPLPIGGQFITMTPVVKDGYTAVEIEVSG